MWDMDYDEAIEYLEDLITRCSVKTQNWNHYHEWECDEREREDISTWKVDATKKGGVYYIGDGVYDPKNEKFREDVFELTEFYIADD